MIPCGNDGRCRLNCHFCATLDVVPGLCVVWYHQAAPWASAVGGSVSKRQGSMEGGLSWVGTWYGSSKSGQCGVCWFLLEGLRNQPHRSKPQSQTASVCMSWAFGGSWRRRRSQYTRPRKLRTECAWCFENNGVENCEARGTTVLAGSNSNSEKGNALRHQMQAPTVSGGRRYTQRRPTRAVQSINVPWGRSFVCTRRSWEAWTEARSQCSLGLLRRCVAPVQPGPSVHRRRESECVGWKHTQEWRRTCARPGGFIYC